MMRPQTDGVGRWLSHVLTGMLIAWSWLSTTSAIGAQVLSEPVRVSVHTDVGTIELELDTARAPGTAQNFLRYVDAGLYENGTFYRSVRTDNQPNTDVLIEVIQGGMDRSRRDLAWPPIRLEGTGETGITHLDGVISMALAGPHTGRAEFFICIGDQPDLDEGGLRNRDGLGFAAFGRVTSGMDVVRAIQARPTDGQTLEEPVRILRMVRAPA